MVSGKRYCIRISTFKFPSSHDTVDCNNDGLKRLVARPHLWTGFTTGRYALLSPHRMRRERLLMLAPPVAQSRSSNVFRHGEGHQFFESSPTLYLHAYSTTTTTTTTTTTYYCPIHFRRKWSKVVTPGTSMSVPQPKSWTKIKECLVFAFGKSKVMWKKQSRQKTRIVLVIIDFKVNLVSI